MWQVIGTTRHGVLWYATQWEYTVHQTLRGTDHNRFKALLALVAATVFAVFIPPAPPPAPVPALGVGLTILSPSSSLPPFSMTGLCSCFACVCRGVGLPAALELPVELGGLIVADVDVLVVEEAGWEMGNEVDEEEGEILADEDEGESRNGAGTT